MRSHASHAPINSQAPSMAHPASISLQLSPTVQDSQELASLSSFHLSLTPPNPPTGVPATCCSCEHMHAACHPTFGQPNCGNTTLHYLRLPGPKLRDEFLDPCKLVVGEDAVPLIRYHQLVIHQRKQKTRKRRLGEGRPRLLVKVLNRGVLKWFDPRTVPFSFSEAINIQQLNVEFLACVVLLD